MHSHVSTVAQTVALEFIDHCSVSYLEVEGEEINIQVVAIDSLTVRCHLLHTGPLRVKLMLCSSPLRLAYGLVFIIRVSLSTGSLCK